MKDFEHAVRIAYHQSLSKENGSKRIEDWHGESVQEEQHPFS
jgi:hypothetical protein